MKHGIRIGITHGDFNGIGYEIIIKTLSDMRICEMCTPVIYGSSKATAFYRNRIEGTENFSPSIVSSAREARLKRVNIVNCIRDEIRIEPGVSAPEAGAAAVAALKSAVADLKVGSLDAIVTAPISKENIRSEAFPYTGHTEFFAAGFGGEPLMLLCSETMRVGLVTIHIPISQVSSAITTEKIIGCLRRFRASLIEDFGVVEPRIAVMSLNPHCGDGGLFGDEEQNIIKPALDAVRDENIYVFGPFAADGLFGSGAFTKYDGILAMYHDQGLAPFKLLSPQGVNFTASLPIIRTSPDHGVAYDIAGKGIADESSMREAIYTALDIYARRQSYKEAVRNPLRRYERDNGSDASVRDLLPETEE